MINLLNIIDDIKKYKSIDKEQLFNQRVIERLEKSFSSYIKDLDLSLYSLDNVNDKKQIEILKLINKKD